jgi:hypothetical protein
MESSEVRREERLEEGKAVIWIGRDWSGGKLVSTGLSLSVKRVFCQENLVDH